MSVSYNIYEELRVNNVNEDTKAVADQLADYGWILKMESDRQRLDIAECEFVLDGKSYSLSETDGFAELLQSAEDIFYRAYFQLDYQVEMDGIEALGMDAWQNLEEMAPAIQDNVSYKTLTYSFEDAEYDCYAFGNNAPKECLFDTDRAQATCGIGKWQSDNFTLVVNNENDEDLRISAEAQAVLVDLAQNLYKEYEGCNTFSIDGEELFYGDDLCVPTERLDEFLQTIQKIVDVAAENGLHYVVYGSFAAGEPYQTALMTITFDEDNRGTMRFCRY